MGVASHLPSLSPKWKNLELPFLPQFLIINHEHLIQVAMLCLLIWGIVRLAIGLMSPAWYDRLNSNATKRNFVIGAMIGLGFKFLTIPSCAVAAYMTAPEDDVSGIHPSMNIYQQVCWGSRGTVTILELGHFLHHRELVLHHMLILVGMSVIGHYNGPHRGFDLALGALVSEIPNSVFMIVKEFGLLSKHPTLKWALPLSSSILGFAFRIPAVVLAMAMVPTSGLRGGHAVIMLIAYLFYMSYVLNITWRRLKRAKVWRMIGDRNFYLRLHSRFIISSTSFYAGLITLGGQLSTLAFAGLFTAVTKSTLIKITYGTVPGALGALFLCCLLLPSVRTEGARKELLLARLEQHARLIKLPRLSTVGGWVFGGWVLLLAYHASQGDTPEIRNKGLSPADIVTQQPALCGLVLSWHFWACTTSVWLLSTLFMSLARDRRFIEPIEGKEKGIAAPASVIEICSADK